MIFTGAWLVMGALWTKPVAKAAVSFTFANKRQLSLVLNGTHAGVYSADELAHPLVVGPPRATTQNRSDLRFSNDRGFILTNDRGLFVIDQSTRTVEVKPLQPLARDSVGEIGWEKLRLITHDGHDHLILHLRWAQPVNTGDQVYDGEIVALREDGEHVRFAISKAGEHPLKGGTDLRNGLFRIDGFPRKLDLDRFELESTMETKIPRRVSNADKSFVDAWPEALQTFTQYARPPAPATVTPTVKAAVATALETLIHERRSVILRGLNGAGREFAAGEIARLLPRGWTVFDLAPDSLHSTASHTGNFDFRLSLMKAASEIQPVVWLTRSIAALRDLGTHSRRDTDFFDIALPEIKDGTLRMLGLTDDAQYTKLVNGRDDVRENFGVVPIESADTTSTRKVVNEKLNARGVKITNDQFELLNQWAARFGPRSADPGRTLGLARSAMHKALKRHSRRLEDADLREAVQIRFNAPPEMIDHDRAVARLALLSTELGRRLPGNETARDFMIAAGRATLFNLRKPGRPRATGLLLGPKGAGKTTLIETYAEIMELPILTLSMTTFSQAYQLPDFLLLAGTFLDNNPAGIVFLDEFDKCATEIQNALLKALESKAFTYQIGRDTRTVSMINAQMFAASNAGAEEIQAAAQNGQQVSEATALRWANAVISDKFTDRMDFVTAVFPSEVHAYRLIVRGVVDASLKRHQITPEHISNFAEMIDFIVNARPAFGSNREAERVVGRVIDDAIGAMLASRQVPNPRALRDQRFRFTERLTVDCESNFAAGAGDDGAEVIRGRFDRAR